MKNKHVMKILLITSLLILTSVACGVCGFLTNLQSSDTPMEIAVIPPTNTQVPNTAIQPTATPQLPKTVQLYPDGSGDYPDLPSAVVDLAPGSTIVLSAGEYALTSPLLVENTLTIVGAGKDETTISGYMGEYVMRFIGPADYALRDLTVNFNGIEGSNVVEVKDSNVTVDNCAFSNAVRNPDEEFGGTGLEISGESNGFLRSSTFEFNGLHGLTIYNSSTIVIEDSLFFQNGQAGLVFWDNTTGEVRNNISQNNGYHGFSTQDQAQVSFEDNLASSNTESGFIAWDTSSMTAQYNTAINNGNNGFCGNEEATLNLKYNLADGNTSAGLSVNDSAFLQAEFNEVSNNILSGIMSSEFAVMVLIENSIHNNVEAGVRASEQSYADAENNDVYENGLSGFIVTDDAQVNFTNNKSHDNIQSGFAFFANAGGTVNDNNCYGNGHSGIGLYGSSNPKLGFNKCEVQDKRD